MNEFSLIQRFFKEKSLQQQSLKADGVVLGIGDDAALLQPPADQQLVISTDTLVAGRHFPLDTPAHAIGWKSAAVNLSDLAAMGATPQAILLAISLPSADEDWLAQFSQGLFDCCAPAKVQLIGGDTTKSPTLTITVTALGWVPTGQAICRQGAQVGDLVMVSGKLGDAAYALQHPASDLQRKLDYPQARNELGVALRGYASSMLDISDGLAQDLGHILEASQVGAVLQLESLPLSSTLQLLEPHIRFQYALAGGDDYELCFTISPQRLKGFYEKNGSAFQLHVIGEIVAEQGLVLQYQQAPVELNNKGYQHFD